ncbi:MAG: XamI family restriction endonuclease [Candidatus Aminicenantes bacterium]|nr:XamI family restriction endonuclease [Candidatus Aminicenantes bacterium]
MAVNRDKPDRWKQDIALSVDMYNHWFMNFAPEAFRKTRSQTTENVEKTLKITDNLTNIQPDILKKHPGILPTLRMSTCPPLAVDRLIGLAGVPANLVKRMEKEKKMPVRMNREQLDAGLHKIGKIIEKMADPDIFVWLSGSKPPAKDDVYRAATIAADRLCGSVANPIIRNAQEKRQLDAIRAWLESRGYGCLSPGDIKFDAMPAGTFSFHTNVPVKLESGIKQVNIPIDVIIMPKSAGTGDFPIFIEAKSAGDFANVNKRRKEEAVKINQLQKTYGERVSFNLFLCGYFDSGYLGYEAAEGIDWVWEHRIDDLEQLGV